MRFGEASRSNEALGIVVVQKAEDLFRRVGYFEMGNSDIWSSVLPRTLKLV